MDKRFDDGKCFFFKDEILMLECKVNGYVMSKECLKGVLEMEIKKICVI